jgi:hypothetical protein
MGFNSGLKGLKPILPLRNTEMDVQYVIIETIWRNRDLGTMKLQGFGHNEATRVDPHPRYMFMQRRYIAQNIVLCGSYTIRRNTKYLKCYGHI